MAKRPLITTVQIPGASEALNNNFRRIAEAFDNTLSREGDTPNRMEADIDLNSNDLLNVGLVDAGELRVGGDPLPDLSQVQEALDLAQQAAQEASEAAESVAGMQDDINQAVADSSEALDLATSVSSLTLPELQSESIVQRNRWSASQWTGQAWGHGLSTDSLPDHPYITVYGDAGSARVVLPNGNRIVSKNVVSHSVGTDYLFKIVVDTSTAGQVQPYIFSSIPEGSNSWSRTSVNITTTGSKTTLYSLISSNAIGPDAAYVRPGVANTGTTPLNLYSMEVIRVEDWLNIYDFVQPGATDWSDAVDEAIRISALCTRPGWIDFKNATFNVTRPIENTVQSSQWRNGIIQVDNNTVSREVFEGGSMDSLGVPRQKGIVRCMANFQKYDGIHLRNTGGPIMITTTNPAGWVVTEGRCVANGFEDVGTRGLQFSNLQVQNYDDYGLRYASPTGGGFRAISAHSRQRVTSGTFDYLDADTNRGYGILLDSNDGHVDKCVPVNGEFPIYQIQGGTIDLNMVHPWGQKTAYYRRYFGPASVPIRTGIQIRDESQIISFDAGLVTVTRDPVNWEVVVTPIAEILEEDATEVVIWRDAVNALLSGYNTNWEGAYFDGGSIRMTRPGHRFGDGCAGIAPAGGNVVALFEWSPAPARLTNDPLSQLWNVINPAYAAKRAIVYPPIAGTAAPPVHIPAFESWYGHNSDTAGHIFSKAGTNNGPTASFIGLGSQPRIAIGNTSASSSIITYNGNPNGNVIANAGSLCLNTSNSAVNSGLSNLYWKSSSGNSLGWRPVKLGDVDISDFGAVPNSTGSAAANSTAFQSAFASAMSRGVRVIIPAGTWWIPEKILIDATADLHVVGMPGAVIKGMDSTGYAAADRPMIEIDGLTTRPSLVVHGIKFDNSLREFVSAEQSGTALSLKRLNDVDIYDCQFIGDNNDDDLGTGNGDSGITAQEVVRMSVHDCYFYRQPDVGIYTTGGSVEGGTDDGGEHNIYANVFELCQVAVSAKRESRRTLFENNIVLYCHAGMTLFETGNNTIPGRESIITGNSFYKTGTRAIDIRGSFGDVISGNQIIDWGYRPDGVTLTNTQNAVFIRGVEGASITGNTISLKDWANSSHFALQLQSFTSTGLGTLNSRRNAIWGNRIFGVTTGINEGAGCTDNHGDNWISATNPVTFASGSQSTFGVMATAGLRRYAAQGTVLNLSRDGGSDGRIIGIERNGSNIGEIQSDSEGYASFVGAPRLPQFTVATLPPASGRGRQLIFVSDEVGGATVAFSNGTNWLRLQDLAIVS